MNRARQHTYRALVEVCQTFGYTTEETYELLDDVIDSLETEPEEDRA